MTIRHNTKFRQKLVRMEPAATDDIREVLSRCAGCTDLQVPEFVIRVIANTGLGNSEFMSLQVSDIDSDGGWLHIGRPRGKYVGGRILPLRPKTISALLTLHRLNPQSEFVLGDSPRTRFDQMIRKLRVVAPQFARTRLWTYSIRMNFACRLMSAGIPSGLVKYCLGHRTKGDPFGVSILTPEQKLQVIRRTLECFLEEL
jgi:integrase